MNYMMLAINLLTILCPSTQLIKNSSITSMITVIYLPSLEEVAGIKQNGDIDVPTLCKVYFYNLQLAPYTSIFCTLGRFTL